MVKWFSVFFLTFCFIGFSSVVNAMFDVHLYVDKDSPKLCSNGIDAKENLEQYSEQLAIVRKLINSNSTDQIVNALVQAGVNIKKLPFCVECTMQGTCGFKHSALERMLICFHQKEK